MPTCSWCGIQYDISPLYHVCEDGLTFADRMVKTPREFMTHVLEGSKSQAIVPADDCRLPEQPQTKSRDFDWDFRDLALLKDMKIKL